MKLWRVVALFLLVRYMEFFEAEDLNPYLELFPLFSYIHSSLHVSSHVRFVYIFKRFAFVFCMNLSFSAFD